MSNSPNAFSVKWNHPSRLILILLFGVMAVYLVLRAVYVSITHDEAFTFFNYINRPINSTLDVTYTNNHLLNSLLARVSRNVFGESVFALRLPNVLGGIAYLIYTLRILLRMSSGKWWVVFAFVAACFNPFVFDFFGLCRGYGISLGLLMASVFYQYKACTETKPFRFRVLALVLTALAVTANYTLFNFFLMQVVFNFAQGTLELFRLRKEGMRKILLHVVPFILLGVATAWFAIAFANMMFKLNELGNFNFGGDNGFWADTASSLTMYSVFPIVIGYDWLTQYGVIVAIAVFAIAAVMLIVALRSKFEGKNYFVLFLFTSIVGCGLALLLQHMIFGIPFSKDRTALYFLPLFGLLALSMTTGNGRLNFLTRIPVALYFLPMILAQVFGFNLDKVIFWPQDAAMEQTTYAVIAMAEEENPEKFPILVGVPFYVYPSFSYYVYESRTEAVQWKLMEDYASWDVTDYMVVLDDFAPGPEYSLAGKYNTKTILKRKSPVTYTKQRLIQKLDFENNSMENRPSLPGYSSATADCIFDQQAFSRLIKDTISDSLGGGQVYLMNFNVLAKETPATVSAIFSIEREGELKMWKVWDLAAFVRSPEKWQPVSVRLTPDFSLQYGDVITFYVMSDGKEKVAVDDLQVTELRIK